MRGLEILSILPSATVQDRGRSGYLRYGLTAGGALDIFALCEGQALLGNGPDDAALELAEFGGRFRATGPLSVACSGAEMGLLVNGAPRVWRQVFTLEADDILDIGAVKRGVYGYLHVAGGFQTASALGSRSTNRRAGLGAVPRAGMTLQAGRTTATVALVSLPEPGHFTQRVLRVMPGPQSELFEQTERQAFLSSEFVATRQRDRMGLRLASSFGPVRPANTATLASDAVNLGDIQITGDGTAVVLLADRGSTGGYPRVATIVTADVPALVQMPSGAPFRLDCISRATAVSALGVLCSKLDRLATTVRPVLRDPRDMRDLLSYNLVGGVVKGDENE